MLSMRMMKPQEIFFSFTRASNGFRPGGWRRVGNIAHLMPARTLLLFSLHLVHSNNISPYFSGSSIL